MTALCDLTLQGISLCILLGIATCFTGIFVAVRSIFKSSVRSSVTACVLVLCSYFLMSLSIQVSRKMRGKVSFDEFMIPVMKCPLGVFIVCNILLLCLISLLFVYTTRFEKITKPGLFSIIEGFDKISSGICCYDENGIVRLKNNMIENLSFAITGHALKDGRDFENSLKNGLAVYGCEVVNSGSRPCIKLPDGRVFSFAFSGYRSNKFGPIKEIMAFDITENHLLNIELAQRADDLSNVNERLKELGQDIRSNSIVKEVLDAKIKIHNTLGQLLIKTSHLIKGSSLDGIDDVMNEWHRQALYLGRDEEEPTADKYSLFFDAAEKMGLGITVNGRLPQNGSDMEIAANAIHQCITNTLQHSDGNALVITAQDRHIEITDNGTTATAPVREGVGLSTLRSTVEASGGTMKTIADGKFTLCIDFV